MTKLGRADTVARVDKLKPETVRRRLEEGAY